MDPFFYFDDEDTDAPEPDVIVPNAVISTVETPDNEHMSAQNKVSFDK